LSGRGGSVRSSTRSTRLVQDSNGDDVSGLRGTIKRLPYLCELGVRTIGRLLISTADHRSAEPVTDGLHLRGDEGLLIELAADAWCPKPPGSRRPDPSLTSGADRRIGARTLSPALSANRGRRHSAACPLELPSRSWRAGGSCEHEIHGFEAGSRSPKPIFELQQRRRSGNRLIKTNFPAVHRMDGVNSRRENRPEESRESPPRRPDGEQPDAENPLLSRGFGPEATVGETVMASGSWRRERYRRRNSLCCNSMTYEPHRLRWILPGES
jgi:hypothetical protein